MADSPDHTTLDLRPLRASRPLPSIPSDAADEDVFLLTATVFEDDNGIPQGSLQWTLASDLIPEGG